MLLCEVAENEQTTEKALESVRYYVEMNARGQHFDASCAYLIKTFPEYRYSGPLYRWMAFTGDKISLPESGEALVHQLASAEQKVNSSMTSDAPIPAGAFRSWSKADGYIQSNMQNLLAKKIGLFFVPGGALEHGYIAIGISTSGTGLDVTKTILANFDSGDIDMEGWEDYAEVLAPFSVKSSAQMLTLATVNTKGDVQQFDPKQYNDAVAFMKT